MVDVLRALPQPVEWLSNANTAWIAIMLLGIWKGIGWAMVIFLAALQTISPDMYEAAAVDGATSWRRFWSITLPLIRPTLLFVTVMLIIGGFQAFISIFLITGGGPLQRTEVMLTYMYRQAFEFLDFGYGAALAYLLALVIFMLSAGQMWLFREKAD